MPRREIHRLDVRTINAATGPKRLHDGDGLYLCVNARGSKAWELRYERAGKRRSMGLGPFPRVTIKQARKLHRDALDLLAMDVDPIDARKAKRHAQAAGLTVREVCENYLRAKRPTVATEKYIEQIESRLRADVWSEIGDMMIADVGRADAIRVLEKIRDRDAPTIVSRVREYMEAVIDFSIEQGLRRDESNPFMARRLRVSFPRTANEKHFAAIPYTEAPEFMAKLRAYPVSVKSLALQFVLLTVCRSGDICGGNRKGATAAKWDQVDLVARTFTIPVNKSGREFVLPLSQAAIDVLEQVRRFADNRTGYIFPGAVRGSAMSGSTMRYLISDLGYGDDHTVHGCRSQFKGWCTNATDYPDHLSELCLQHALPRLHQAYLRGDMPERRRAVLDGWASFLLAPAAGKVADLNVAA